MGSSVPGDSVILNRNAGENSQLEGAFVLLLAEPLPDIVSPGMAAATPGFAAPVGWSLRLVLSFFAATASFVFCFAAYFSLTGPAAKSAR